ncbi:MAG: prenyltransferase/squalene oxidase repeat-containing protein, partial [Planctomycetota bacterium]
RGALVGPSAATGVWDEFVTEHPESRWAWQAAGLLSSTAFGAAGKFKTGWLTDEVLEAQRQKTFQPLPAEEASLAERQAVEWLLAHQRPDGSWISPAERSNVDSLEPNEFTLAITAICGQALLGYGADEHADAVEHALEAVISIHDLFRSRVPVRYFMDYGVWSRAYLLGFLVECTVQGVREHDELADRIRKVIEELGERQKPDGGWSYYVTADLGSSTSPPLPSMTFTTAAVLLPLLRAHDEGFAVPEQSIERGLDLLEAARNQNGTFEYMLSPGIGSIVAGAAGRGPVCTLALLHGGRAEVDDLRTALELFAQHRGTYMRERGKSLMHCGSEGQGSHYLTFDYAYAAQAVRLLPSGERGRYRAAVLESVLSGRSEEGSYLDNPLIGWALGTAFAVWAFQALGAF